MNTYLVVVSQTKYPDYPCVSSYYILSANEHDAGIGARKFFVQDFGFGFTFTKFDYIKQTVPAPETGINHVKST